MYKTKDKEGRKREKKKGRSWGSRRSSYRQGIRQQRSKQATVQIGLPSKVCDLCQIYNWARTVTLPPSFTWRTPVSLRPLVGVVLWLWLPWVFLMEVVDSVFGVVKILNRLFSSIFNWLSRLFDQVLELLSRHCWLGVKDFFNLELFIYVLTNDRATKTLPSTTSSKDHHF